MLTRLATIFVVLCVLAGTAHGQTNLPQKTTLSTGSYPIMLAGNKPLAVGTHVWTNIGDGPCTYSRSNRNWPLANRECFTGGKVSAEYHRAVIKKMYLHRGGTEAVWVYTVEYIDMPLEPVGDYGNITRDASFDDGFKFFNLPPDLAAWSQFFIRTNW
jgi:hypothetical protein